MSSIVKEIYDRFDRHPLTDTAADYSHIGYMDIRSARNGYRLIPHVGNSVLGMNIDIAVPNGIFSTAAPTKVETSPNFGGLGKIEVKDSSQVGTTTGVIGSAPAVEGLLLPGDQGFDLFTDLHKQVSALKPIVAGAMKSLCYDIELQSFDLEETSGKRLYHRSTGETEWERNIYYQIASTDHVTFGLRLDGSVITSSSDMHVDAPIPDGIKPGSQPVFRAGEYSRGAGARSTMPMESLVAFSGMQHAIEQLYA